MAEARKGRGAISFLAHRFDPLEREVDGDWLDHRAAEPDGGSRRDWPLGSASRRRAV